MKKVYNMCEEIGNFRREMKTIFFFLKKNARNEKWDVTKE